MNKNKLRKETIKIFISYPPLKSKKGIAQIGQNRQFQWFAEHSVIYPMVPAYAATLLKQEGYEVFWDDAIAKKENYSQWIKRIEQEKPDLIAIETKTPVVKEHWKIINEIKKKFPEIKIVLMGDHVTELPEESMEKSLVDFVITGGDYDFSLLSICEKISKNKKLESGIWYREKGKIKNSGNFNLNHDLNQLPFIDRDLTRWDLYKENGNYKYLPGTYTIAGRDCWWGKCKFCFIGDMKVMTNKGVFPIKEIVEKKEGINVLTKEGKLEKIKEFLQRDYKGNFVELKTQYLTNKIICTEDHNILTWDKKLNFKEAKDLTKGDYLAIPIIKGNMPIKEIDFENIIQDLKVNTFKGISEKNINKIIEMHDLGKSERSIAKELKLDRGTIHRYIVLFKNEEIIQKSGVIIEKEKISCISSKTSINKKIKLEKDFFRLIGFYLAEGNVYKHKNRRNSYTLSFTFSEKEREYIDYVKESFKKYFNYELREIYNKTNHTIQLTCLSNICAILFKKLFNSISTNKDIPFEWLFESKENQSELIKGLFYGDGHLRIRNKSGCEYIHSTASEQLSWKILNILLRLEVIPRQSIRKISGKKQKHLQYITSINEIGIRKIFKNKFDLPKRKYNYQHGFFKEGYLFTKIINKHIFSAKEKVYNLTVNKSHSYTINGIAVANCSWPSLFPKYRTRKPELLFEEIKMLVEKYKIKEIMDDSGTFPVGEWLKKFCNLMIQSGLNKKVRISCNMRFGVLKYEDYKLMRKAGFRFLLFGLESANQETLDRIDKGIKVEDIIEGCKMAKKAGLNPHLTCMVGYPWENYEMAKKTVDLAKKLFKEGYADTLQATIVVPYPNTKLYKECLKNNWLDVKDKEWEKFDMRNRIMKSPLTESQIKELVSSFYKLAFNPKFIFRQLISIRNYYDFLYIIRGGKKVLGKHLKDFSKK